MMRTKKGIQGHRDRPEVQMRALWVTASLDSRGAVPENGLHGLRSAPGSSNLSVRSPRPRCGNRIRTLVETSLA